MRRPGVLVAGPAVLALTLALAGCGAIPGSVTPVDEAEFTNELAIPPLAPSRVVDGTRVFELTAREGTTQFRPGVETGDVGLQRLLPRADAARRTR